MICFACPAAKRINRNGHRCVRCMVYGMILKDDHKCDREGWKGYERPESDGGEGDGETELFDDGGGDIEAVPGILPEPG